VGLKLHKTVVLIGMMGAGKTAVGTELSRLIGVGFLDSDEEIVRAASMSIAEIFARDGEPFFRLKETQVIARLLRDKPGVLSVGGGAFLNAETRKLISDLGVAVWLRADLDLLWNRVRHKTTRPLLHTPNPRATLAAMLETRTPIYSQANLTVDARPEYSIETMATKVVHTLASRPDVLEHTPEQPADAEAYSDTPQAE
jgi:shikimate kinase